MDDHDPDLIFTDSESSGEDIELSDDFEDSRKNKRPTREQPLDPEVQALIGEAQQVFSAGDHAGAIKLAEEAISLDGSARIAYNLLTAIYDDIGDQNKALLAKVAATHLNKKSKEDWLDVAERSIEQGLLEQASVFLQAASRVARDDWTLLFRRAQLNMQMNEQTKALSLLTRLRTKFSAQLTQDIKTQVLLSTARVLKALGKVDEATQLYLDVFQKSTAPETYGEPYVVLNWQNLNVLGDLLHSQGLHARVIRTMKTGARWILGRGSETFWNDEQNDFEFDERGFAAKFGPIKAPSLGPPDKHSLPIDIRLWLLVCRLKLVNMPGAAKDALIHLEYLKLCLPVEDFADLYTRAADAFFQAQMFESALETYVLLTDIPFETQEEYLAMQMQVAKCEVELGNTSRAEQLYQFVASTNEYCIDALIALGEIYQATGRLANAKQMMERVSELRSNFVPSGLDVVDSALIDPGQENDLNAYKPGGAGAYVHSARTRTPIPSRLSAAEKAELERQMQKVADFNFSELARFQRGLDSNNDVAAMEWLRAAAVLIDMFVETRKFFPSDKNKTLNLDSHKLLLEEEMDDVTLGDSDALAAYRFRGHSFEEWFALFMRTALAQAAFGSLSRSYEIVRGAQMCIVFYQDQSKQLVMNLVHLACARKGNDYHSISEVCRHIYTEHFECNDLLRVYLTVLGSGPRAMATFGSSNNQKFFLRQIKAIDGAVQKKTITGAARLANGDAITEENPYLFVLYGHMMLMGPSYVPALTYLMRAVEELPQDPVLLLTIAVVYLQRAIQRVTTNRHLQILQALTYMQKYDKVRSSQSASARQEVEYNKGRFWHGIGLFHLAGPCYERVLKLHTQVEEQYDLSREAAYNLHLITAFSGNMEKSRRLVEEFLVV